MVVLSCVVVVRWRLVVLLLRRQRVPLLHGGGRRRRDGRQLLLLRRRRRVLHRLVALLHVREHKGDALATRVRRVGGVVRVRVVHRAT